MRTAKKYIVFLTTATLCLGIASSATAAKAPDAGSSRGKLNVYIVNDKNDVYNCAYRLTGSNLERNQSLYIASNDNTFAPTQIGYVNGVGDVVSISAYLSVSAFNKNFRMNITSETYYRVNDIFGYPAAISVSNNCVP